VSAEGRETHRSTPSAFRAFGCSRGESPRHRYGLPGRRA
jgi:hypothetical protein